MKKATAIALVVIGFLGILYWMSLEHTTENTHIHFTAQTGYLVDILYYSDKPPEKADQHICDNRFAEMPDHMFAGQLERWRARYRK